MTKSIVVFKVEMEVSTLEKKVTLEIEMTIYKHSILMRYIFFYNIIYKYHILLAPVPSNRHGIIPVFLLPSTI